VRHSRIYEELAVGGFRAQRLTRRIKRSVNYTLLLTNTLPPYPCVTKARIGRVFSANVMPHPIRQRHQASTTSHTTPLLTTDAPSTPQPAIPTHVKRHKKPPSPRCHDLSLPFPISTCQPAKNDQKTTKKQLRKLQKIPAITSSSVNPSPEHRLKPPKTLKVSFKLKTATNPYP
jgi:hypothetical protein